MRLLQYDSQQRISLAKDYGVDEKPQYAILSHTWDRDNSKEVTFGDIEEDDGWWKEGYRKLEFCAKQATKDGLEYFWVDTCCINKVDPHELSEAIISMFRWYREAQKCYVYLSDVSTRTSDGQLRGKHEWEYEFRKSRWFTRGWTLQELLAPRTVEFFSRNGELLGTKETLAAQIHEITTIPLPALQNKPLWQFSDIEKMRWTENRQTKKEEDNAYCLLGIFGVFMPLMYGEGENALLRLWEEIEKKKNRDTANRRVEHERLPESGGSVNKQQNINRGNGPMNNIASIAGHAIFNQVFVSGARGERASGSPHSLTLSEREFLDAIGPRKFWYVDERVEGTCIWSAKSTQFTSWLAAAKSSVLWITGAAGTGKTTIANFLVEQLEQCYSPSDTGLTDRVVCSFFCSREIEGRHDVLSLLKDLILQIARPRKRIIRIVKSMYGTGKQESGLSLDRAWQIFGTVLKSLTCQSLFIAIDALDECDDALREQLLRRLANTISTITNYSPATCKVIKIIFSGQPQIRTSWNRTFKNIEHHQIDIEDRSAGMLHDLDLFIEVRVDDLVEEKSYSSEVGQFLKDTLKSMAESSFLWLDVIIKHIQQSLAYQFDDVKQLVANVPDDLHQAYSKYLPPVPFNGRLVLQRYLQLLIACSRPLLLAEIDILIGSDHGDTTRILAAGSANNEVVRASMQRALGPLVKFPQDTAQFCHSTARDFFMAISQQPQHSLYQSHSVDLRKAHSLCAKLCLSYLLHPNIPSDIFNVGITVSTPIDESSPTLDDSQLDDHEVFTNLFDIEDVGFLRDPDLVESEICAAIRKQWGAFDYAALNWTYHLKKTGENLDKHLTAMALSLMTGESGRSSDWYRYLRQQSRLQMPASDTINEIVLAAMFDLDHLLRVLLDDSSFRHDEESLFEALFWASSRGCQDVVKLLLASGTSARAVHAHRVPLVIAAQGGFEDICNLLLQSSDVDPNQCNVHGKSALIVAAEANHDRIVRSILQHRHVRPDGLDGDGRTALMAACRNGSFRSVQVLRTDSRIGVNTTDSKGLTAFHYASQSGHLDVVYELLKMSDLDKSIVDLAGRNAISHASQQGHFKVVRLLMKHGLDPAKGDKTGRNSISWASNSIKAMAVGDGQESVLQYLVRKAPQAADVQDCDGWTPLAWAIDTPGYVKAVEVLLSSPQVDVNRRDDSGRGPLAWAVASGMTDIVRRFLQRPDVDVNATSHHGMTPIMVAASEGMKTVVEVLLQSPKIDVGLRDKFGRTAADRAQHTNHEDIAQLLQNHRQS